MAFLLPACLGAMFQVLLNNDKFLALGWILSGIILYFWGKKLHNKETNIITLYDENGFAYEFKKHVDTFFGDSYGILGDYMVCYCNFLSIGFLIL